MATFSCDDSSSLRSFRICCEGRQTQAYTAEVSGWGGKRGAVACTSGDEGWAPYLRLHPLLSLEKGAQGETGRESRRLLQR